MEILFYCFNMGAVPLCGGALLLVLWLRLCVCIKAKSQEPRRQKVIIAEPSIYILRVMRGLQYLWKGPEILGKAHVKDIPYAICTPEAYQVQFSSREHIKQLVQAPDTHLSLHALAKDMFQPKYTMNGLGVDDCMSANGTIHQRALQAELRSHLPALRQPLGDCIARTLAEEMANTKPQPRNAEWRSLQTFPMAKRLITRANALVFFGPEVSTDPVFLNAALEYPEHLMQTAEVLRLLPSWLAPFVSPYLMRGHRALKILLDRLTPVVEARLLDTTSTARNKDCIQFFINASIQKHQQHEWPAQRIIQVLLGIWFASVHQPAMCLFYALDDLTHLDPESITELRHEVLHNPNDINNLPLLNSFLKESARLNPTDSISLRRKVLQPFTLADGTHLVKNDIACIPLQPILQNPEFYNDPLVFNPYRFVNMNNTSATSPSTSTSPPTPESDSDFTNAAHSFPIWGLGKRACPGRYYASLLLKLVLAQILRRYELRMPTPLLDGAGGHPQETKKRFFYWRSAIVPRDGAVLYFREREGGFNGLS